MTSPSTVVSTLRLDRDRVPDHRVQPPQPELGHDRQPAAGQVHEQGGAWPNTATAAAQSDPRESDRGGIAQVASERGRRVPAASVAVIPRPPARAGHLARRPRDPDPAGLEGVGLGGRRPSIP